MEGTVNIKEVVIGYKITSFDYGKRMCNVTIYIDRKHTGKGEEKNFKGVKVSSLLAWRLENQPKRFPIKKWVVGLNGSINRRENPYQVIKYTDKVTGKAELLIAPVEQRSRYIPVTYDAFGNKLEGEPVNRFHKREYYLRWRNLVKQSRRTVNA